MKSVKDIEGFKELQGKMLDCDAHRANINFRAILRAFQQIDANFAEHEGKIAELIDDVARIESRTYGANSRLDSAEVRLAALEITKRILDGADQIGDANEKVESDYHKVADAPNPPAATTTTASITFNFKNPIIYTQADLDAAVANARANWELEHAQTPPTISVLNTMPVQEQIDAAVEKTRTEERERAVSKVEFHWPLGGWHDSARLHITTAILIDGKAVEDVVTPGALPLISRNELDKAVAEAVAKEREHWKAILSETTSAINQLVLSSVQRTKENAVGWLDWWNDNPGTCGMKVIKAHILAGDEAPKQGEKK